jgi:hypothetical protein
MAEKVAYFLESVLISLPIPLLSVYLMHCCPQDPRRSVFFRTIIALWLSYLALLVVAQFSTLFYSVTPDTQFYRGPWYPVLLLPLFAIMLLNTMGLPTAIMGMIVGISRPIDMIHTALNVTGDVVSTLAVARMENMYEDDTAGTDTELIAEPAFNHEK